MSEVGIGLVTAFVVFLLGGVPIVFTLGMAAVIGLWIADIDIIVLAQRIISGSQVFSLLAVPGFILAGELMTKGGLSRRLVHVCHTFVQHLTGGLGMVTVLSATFFAAISGSAPATTSAIGSIMIPEMESRGYRRDFSTGLAVAAGPIGQMIPPSIPMIIWGVISEQSIAKLFLAGVIPGLLIAVGLMILCAVMARSMGVSAKLKRATGREMLAALAEGKWALGAPVIVLGGIYGGIFTPTEAASVGVVYGFVVGFFIYKEISLKDLPAILLDSMKVTSIVVFVIATASVFGWLVAIEQVPTRVAAALLGISDNPIVILLILNLLLLFLGAVMDNIAAMIILGGVLMAVGQQIGIDPIHLGAIIVINFAIGMATPPFGYSLFVGAAISKLTIEQISRAIWPMLIVEIIVLGLVTYMPWTTLLLPRLFF